VHTRTLALFTLALLTAACDARHSDAELAQLRAQTNAENERRIAARSDAGADERRPWTLTLEGQTKRGPATLSLAELRALATAHVLAPWDRLTKTYGCAILVTQSVVDAIAEPAKHALRLARRPWQRGSLKRARTC
jgi:hypothetical protein